ncbi:hypothetical protein [Paraburkholderia dinghuensis]|uniref:RHS repeat protein n=1 Tax=Paraburkholderia dinghuensis TaxID=2305225 RepID=A0A3N6MMF3_9BURK|nr:hypothetical protein [Paraburkholderia dinghuensis]RQH02745.1 hypothetical protein D1Y85_21675 [Paraburkholderia dinghuensis]
MVTTSQQITGNEAFWGAIKGQLSSDVLKYINSSQTLVNELLQYGAAVAGGTLQPMQISLTGSGNLLQFTGQFVQFGLNWLTWSPAQFVGNLSHEIGHFVNFSNDQTFYQNLHIDPNDPNAGALYDTVGLRAEGEAVFNNWKVQQEIALANPGVQININGDSGANGSIDQALSALHASDIAKGLTQVQDDNALMELAGKMFSSLHPSDTPAGTTYADMYAAHGGEIFSSMGISSGNVLPGAIAEVDFSDSNLTGNYSSVTETFASGASTTQYFSNSLISSSVQLDQFGNVLSQVAYSHNADGSYVANIYDGQGHLTNQDQFQSDGSEVAYQINSNGSQTATVYNSTGHETEYAAFGTNGQKTQDIFYDATSGRETQETDYNADGSAVAYLFNSDGTQNAIVYNSAGHETEYATFGTNGAKTQDLFYDASSGRLTQENDFNADGSAVAHLFNSDGTQNAIVYNSAGHETEYATFGTNGAKTQDLFYDASSGRLTQENDYNADGSAVAHLFNSDGTQNAIVYNSAGHETEYATFGTNGAKTQDLFYDASSGRLTQENDFNADGSQVDHVFNANGTQNAIVFNAAGHETENATFGTNGQKTQDVFYDATSGRATQENDFNADGSQVDHVFNTDGTQTAYVFNAAGHETEQANFDTSGKQTKDFVFDANTGREMQETDYNADGSGVAHVFNPDGTQNAAVFDPSGHVSEYATFGANGQKTKDIFYDPGTGRELQENDFNGDGSSVAHVFNPDGSQTATVYNSAGHETEYAAFNVVGQKTDDYFYDGTTGRETEYNQYHGDGGMTAWLFNADNSTNAIIFNGNGQELEYDSYDTSGQLTGYTKFTYGPGGGYNAVAYGPTGYESGWADYGSNDMLISSGGSQYNFGLGNEYGSGSDMAFESSFQEDLDMVACDYGFSF